MSYTLIPSAVTGQQYSAKQHNTYVRANLSSIWVYTTAGDMSYANGATELSRLGLTSGGVLIGGASAPQWLAPGSAGQYLGPAVTTIPAWKNDGVPGIFAAAGDMVYGSAADTAALLSKPVRTSILQNTNGGLVSWRRLSSIVIELELFDSVTEVSTGVAGYFFIPSQLNGAVLISALANLFSAGSAPQSMDIQVENATKYPGQNVLSIPMNIYATRTSTDNFFKTTTIDTNYDDVSTNDRIKIFVSGHYFSATRPKGLWVRLTYQLP